jgi:hypothetical protein
VLKEEYFKLASVKSTLKTEALIHHLDVALSEYLLFSEGELVDELRRWGKDWFSMRLFYRTMFGEGILFYYGDNFPVFSDHLDDLYEENKHLLAIPPPERTPLHIGINGIDAFALYKGHHNLVMHHPKSLWTPNFIMHCISYLPGFHFSEDYDAEYSSEVFLEGYYHNDLIRVRKYGDAFNVLMGPDHGLNYLCELELGEPVFDSDETEDGIDSGQSILYFSLDKSGKIRAYSHGWCEQLEDLVENLSNFWKINTFKIEVK